MLLQEKDFSFSVLDQHRSSDSPFGISGELLLAENGTEIYVVKHTDPFDAAVEYMTITLATKLRLNCTPTAHLFTPSGRFPHAIGIQYLPDLNPPQKKENVLKCVILNFLIDNGDHTEIGESNGHIYTLDFGESFCFDYHNKTEEFLSQCRAAHTDKAVRDRIIPVFKTDYDRYLHMLGYANEVNYFETAQVFSKENNLGNCSVVMQRPSVPLLRCCPGRVPESQTPGGEITDPRGKKHLSRSPFFHWKKSDRIYP